MFSDRCSTGSARRKISLVVRASSADRGCYGWRKRTGGSRNFLKKGSSSDRVFSSPSARATTRKRLTQSSLSWIVESALSDATTYSIASCVGAILCCSREHEQLRPAGALAPTWLLLCRKPRSAAEPAKAFLLGLSGAADLRQTTRRESRKKVGVFRRLGIPTWYSGEKRSLPRRARDCPMPPSSPPSTPVRSFADGPRMTCSSFEASTPPVGAVRRAVPTKSDANAAVPSQMELAKFIKHETAAELNLVRRGEEAAVCRINQLKAMNATHERTIALLTQTLAAQSEMLQDCRVRVSSLAKALPEPPQPSSASPTQSRVQQPQTHPPWEAVSAAIRTLNQRLQRGMASRSPSSASSRPPR